MQKAVDVPWDKMHGPMDLTELNKFFDEGWTVAPDIYPVQNGGGDILVILQSPDTPSKTNES